VQYIRDLVETRHVIREGVQVVANITTREQQEIERANESALKPIVFVHGLWLLPGSWDRWRALAEEQGYTTLAPGWPDDPETVEEANRDPEVFAKKHIKQITDHYVEVIQQLRLKPAIVGHSFGGLIAEQLAGKGVAAVTVAISPAPFRGVLPLPFSALKSASAALRNPANYNRAVPLSFEQFRFSFGNTVPESEAHELYEKYAVPGSGAPLFQAAAANLNPWTEDTVDTTNPQRGPLLIIAGEKDNTVPWAIAYASYKRQKRNAAATEITEIPGRGHSLTIDEGWKEVADTALAFIKQHA
jgi:pimeloyl-ACP methyl ester carboxylesterase